MSSSPALFSSYANLRFNSAIKADEKADTYETASGQGYNGRLCDITQLWQSESEPGECFLTGQTAASRSLTKTRFGNNSFLVRRNVFSYSTDKKTEVQLEIQSETLQDIIGEVAPHLRSTVNLEARPIIIKAPYHELYHFRDEIAAANLSSGAFSAKQDLVKIELETLQKFIVEIFGRMIPEIEAFKSCRKISMEYLWAIFKPGEPVLLRRQDPSGELETCCGILQSYFDDKRSDGSMIWCLRIRYMSLEGGRFGVVERQYEFDVFLGQMDISTLPAYPLKYCTHPERTKIDLARRGKVFIDLCRNGPAIGAPTHKTYNGPVWIHRKDWEPDGCKFFDSPERTVSHARSFRRRTIS
jgi:hypothetical protein